MIRSLRLRLVLGTAALAAAVIAAAGLVGWQLAREGLLAEFDARLETQLHVLSGAVERSSGRIRADPDVLRLPEFTRAGRPDLGAVWDPEGTMVLGTPAAAGLWMRAPPVRTAASELELPGGVRARCIVQRLFLPDGGPPLTVAVAREAETLHARLDRLATIMAGTGALGAAAAAAGMALLVPLLLRPLASLAERIAGIDPGRPVRLGPAGLTELEPAMQTLDALLQRLVALRERERAFLADAAHELRTPLAAVRAALEAPGDGADPLAEIRRLERVVADLLALARLDAGAVQVVAAPVDLAGVVQQRWDLLAAQAETRQLRPTLDLAPTTVMGDEAKLDTIVRNLLENAVIHADPGTGLEVRLRQLGGDWLLTVANRCASLRPDDAARATQRFWRADHARAGGHSGLGLSIAVRLAALCSCRLDLATTDGRFIADLRVPAAIGG